MALLPDHHSRFVAFQWLDGAAVFDRETGDTHTLDPVSAFLMSAANESSSDPLVLLGRYAAETGSSLSEDAVQAGLVAYQNLVQKGLIEQGKS